MIGALIRITTMCEQVVDENNNVKFVQTKYSSIYTGVVVAMTETSLKLKIEEDMCLDFILGERSSNKLIEVIFDDYNRLSKSTIDLEVDCPTQDGFIPTKIYFKNPYYKCQIIKEEIN